MRQQIKCKKAKFWILEGVLFCKFIVGEYEKGFSDEFLDDYLNAITTLSDGKFFPLIIDLRELNEDCALSIVRTIATNSKIKSSVLSKSFVVNTYFIQLVLIVLRGIQDPEIPNKIFSSYSKAVAYSLSINQSFNAVS